MPDNVDASERMVDDWTRRVQEQAERYQAMAARVEGLSVTERSRDGAVEVTISSKGLLTNLVIAESAQGRRMAEVSALIMRTVQAAQARIPELLQQAMAETIGTEDQTANKVFEDARRQFPDPPEDEPAPPEPQREMRFGPEDEEPPPAGRPGEPPKQPQPPPQPPQARPRRRAAPDDDDDDFGGRSILS
ncbi:YbaB/EbfC family nucleoid-associated protein [Qaidamihabitans albus]|uniref:YbaB/EbfC family nucleoid-associated protein n=1 Tax=Qaidamihabitans albus TaxID=2795733 RepID=UPI0018F2583F|nr:YbaB/EbfC family nucleoid-associated protein [Qaidamihabitans albus]